MGNSQISEKSILNKDNENKTIINNSLIQNKNKTFEIRNNPDIKNNNIKIKEIQIIKNNKKVEPLNKNINNRTDTNLSKNNLEINKNNENLNEQDDINKESQELDENLNINFSINNLLQSDEKNKNIKYKSIKINPNLYEFISTNDEYYHYDYKENKIQNESEKSNDLNTKNINNDKHSNKEILSSQRTINVSNSDAEFSFDNKNKSIKKNYKNKLKSNKFSSCNKNRKQNQNKNNFKNKTNIFNNVRVYDLNDSNSNKNKILSKKDSKKYSKNSKEQEVKKIKDKKNIKQNFIRINKSLKKINVSSNNLILIPNDNNYKNKLYKTSSYTKKNNIIQKAPSTNNLINNNQINKQKMNNINPFRDHNYYKLNKRNINSKSQQHGNKIKNNQINLFNQTSSSNNYSYNYKNFYICSDPNCNLYEKQKLTELIEKIPNDELKNEIMILYQRIINYNKEVIISNKNNSFDYLITFSNNYIKINDNKSFGKKFDEKNFVNKNEINIFLKPTNKNNIINENKDVLKTNNSKNSNENSNVVLFSLNNESFIKQYTFKDEENDNENKNLGKTEDSNGIIKSQINNYIGDKIEVNNVNEGWKNIINLNEVIVSKDKIYSNSVLEKNNYTTKANTRETDVSCIKKSKNKIKRYYSLNNKETNKSNNNLKKMNSSKNICEIYRSRSKNSTFKINKMYNICLSNEKILFEKNINKLKKVNELIKNINSAKNKNKAFKEDNLIMFSVICLLSNAHFLIFKDKESIYPLFKKKLNLIRKVSVIKRSNNFILIIKFDNSDEKINNEVNKNIFNKDDHTNEDNIGILINKKNYYNEFVKILKQLISNLEIEYLN